MVVCIRSERPQVVELLVFVDVVKEILCQGTRSCNHHRAVILAVIASHLEWGADLGRVLIQHGIHNGSSTT